MTHFLNPCQRLFGLMMIPSPLLFLLLCLPLAVLAEGEFELDAEHRTGLSMTIFNNNLAVVRDRREAVLPKGHMGLKITDIAMTLVPPTVSLVSLDKKGFLADRQNYRFDLINRQSILERFLGRKLKYSRLVREGATFEKVLREGILLSINPEIVQFGDVIEVEPEGTISLPYLPDDLTTEPTLEFRGENMRHGRQALNVRYHMTGIEWTADYALTIADKGQLEGWVTINNHSGSDFDIDELRLVAGDLNQATPQAKHRPEMARMAMMDSAPANLASVEVGESHLYGVPGTVRLLKNDTTQLRLLAATGIRYEKSYRLVSSAQQYANQTIEVRRPSAWISFDNNAKNDLNVPLPSGRVRVYEADNGQETFVGGGTIAHKPVGSKIEIELGHTFDITSERSQVAYRRLGDRAAESTYRVKVVNAKKEDVTVTIREMISGDWEMVEQSQKGRKLHAGAYEFDLKLPAGSDATLEYQVRFRW